MRMNSKVPRYENLIFHMLGVGDNAVNSVHQESKLFYSSYCNLKCNESLESCNATGVKNHTLFFMNIDVQHTHVVFP